MTTKLRKKVKKPKAKSGATKKSGKLATASKKKAQKASTAQAPKLPRAPKGGLKDIGLMSFGKKAVRKKPSKAAAGGLGVGLAASVADRRRAGDTRVSPFRKICDLVITAGDGSLHSGTAFFISPRMLVTCGHCLFVFRPGTPAHGPVRKVLVMPARNGETNASQSLVGWVEVTTENMRVHDRWRLEGNLDFDYGVLILPPNQPLGAQVGFFNVSPFPDQTLNGARPTLSGYPDNVPDGTQWFETNPIRQVAPARLFYDIFTFGGQSGSPVFFAHNTQETACAVHNFGNVPFNSGVRITPAVIAQLNAWRV
jgi:V8-like Glu-specific endopeptidase